MKLKRETHVCPQCDSRNLRKSSPADHKEDEILEENPNDFLCEECGYYGPCALVNDDGKETEEEDLELQEIEEEKPKKEKKEKKTVKKSSTKKKK